MKKLINSMIVKRAVKNSSNPSFDMGISNVRENEFADCVKYLRSIGFNVCDNTITNIENNHRLLIVIEDTSTSNKITELSPYEFLMGRKALMNFTQKINIIGVSMSVIIRAYADTLTKFDESRILELRKYKLEDVIDYIGSVLGHAGVNLNKKKINPSVFSQNLRFLGGYQGLSAIITDCVEEFTCGDEEPNVQGVDSMCHTCKHCKFDENGIRYCDAAQFSVPKDFTVERVQKIYPDVEIYNGTMYSNYVPLGTTTCNVCSKRRVPK